MANLTILDRLMSKVVQVTESGCWIWMGALNWAGYGMFWHEGRFVRAHRISYIEHKGLIPAGLEPDHLCRVRCCINPHHLEAVTRKTNLNRGINHESTKTHCPQGHPYDETNTYRSGTKKARVCRICAAAKGSRWYFRQKSIARQLQSLP
jgi:HNH endonuclease